jgi:hypothetical protein
MNIYECTLFQWFRISFSSLNFFVTALISFFVIFCIVSLEKNI